MPCVLLSLLIGSLLIGAIVGTVVGVIVTGSKQSSNVEIDLFFDFFDLGDFRHFISNDDTHVE